MLSIHLPSRRMGHLGTYGNIFFALDCFTLPRNHHIPNTGLFAILFNHSSISVTTIHRRKTCINCRVKKMTTWWYIANVIQSPLSWCHHIYQIVAVYWRLKLPWKSAYEIIPVNWKSLAPTPHLHFFCFQLLQNRFQIIYKSQEKLLKVCTDGC